jgi:catechol 2,3-dioxygenase-like lactoylglutathione lyase family enzyme
VSDLQVSRAFYEQTLGLRVIEEKPDSVKFDVGHVILALKRAQDYGVEVPLKPDGSADIVFLVDDLIPLRTALEQRGVVFNPTSWYEVGGLADFYDPDWHWFTLYQPSEEAMSWPSAKKIRAVRQARQGLLAPTGPQLSAMTSKDSIDPSLNRKELIYLFVFVEDIKKTETFYHKMLGLRALEGGPCSQLCSGDVEGVVKYDAGGIMLTTHFIDESRTQAQVDEHLCPPRELDLQRFKSVVAGFYVHELDPVMGELAQCGVHFNDGPIAYDDGRKASFEDPTGHLFYLYEPSPDALRSRSGIKIDQILSTAL